TRRATHEENRLGERRRGRGAVLHRSTASPLRAHHRGLDGVGERGMRRAERQLHGGTTTTGTGTCWARGGGGTSGTMVVVSDDNYGGGDDNYPRVVVKLGVVEREVGRGLDRQK